MKNRIPDTPFEESSPTHAVKEKPPIPACVKPRCRVVAWGAFVMVALLSLGRLLLTLRVELILGYASPVQALIDIVLLSLPAVLLGIASRFCRTRSGSLLLCIGLPFLMLGSIFYLVSSWSMGSDALWELGETVWSLSFLSEIVLLLLYPFFRGGDYLLHSRRPAARHLMKVLCYPALLLLLPLFSPPYFYMAERPYYVSIEGCESGHIRPVQPHLFLGCMRPLSKMLARELCSFCGNLMEDRPETFHVEGPAGEYEVVMGQDDGPINYIKARLNLPPSSDEAAFTLALSESLWSPDSPSRTTSIRVYRMEDYGRAYPRWREGFYYRYEPKVPPTPLYAADGTQLGPVSLPFGAYVIEEHRVVRDEDDSPCTHYYLQVMPRS